jgi:hypothetical protein
VSCGALSAERLALIHPRGQSPSLKDLLRSVDRSIGQILRLSQTPLLAWLLCGLRPAPPPSEGWETTYTCAGWEGIHRGGGSVAAGA